MCVLFLLFKQKTAYEMRISDWSSDVCSSDRPSHGGGEDRRPPRGGDPRPGAAAAGAQPGRLRLKRAHTATENSATAPAWCSAPSHTGTTSSSEIGRESGRARVSQYGSIYDDNV